MTCLSEAKNGHMFLSDGQYVIFLIDIGSIVSSRNVELGRY